MTTVHPPLTGGPTLPQERRLITSLPGPRSRSLADRRKAAVADGVSSAMPIFAAAAGGGVVVDVDGNSLIDLGSGIAVTTIGNADPSVAAGVADQAALFTHTCFTITPYEGYLEVAERLNRLTPGKHPQRTALFNSGAEAVENAVKIARYYTGRSAVVAFDHAYHGRTNLTMALTSKAMPYKSGFGPFAADTYRAPMSYPFRDHLSGAEAARRTIGELDKQIGAANIAALIIEPIQGEGGFIVPADGFLPALNSWCRQNGVLFIADEIQTGFARTGDLFACEHEGIVPDLITTAKGVAGGLPLAGVTGRADVMDAPHRGGLGGTYTGNPVSCAAAIAALDLYETAGLVERARAIEDLVTDRLVTAQQHDPRIGDIRGRGAMLAVELVDPDSGDPATALTAAVSEACHRNGVITLTCGDDANVIRLLPPLSIPDPLLREGVDVLLESLAAV